MIIEFCYIVLNGRWVFFLGKEEEGKGREGWILFVGNGIKVVVEGYVLKEGIVKSGEIVKVGEKNEKLEKMGKGVVVISVNGVVGVVFIVFFIIVFVLLEKEMEFLVI